jgi:opacity protein-like surface antigen
VSILPPVPAAATGFQAGFTPTGWAAGAGFEYRIAPSWSAKLEYQFIDLGRETTINPFDRLAYSQSFNFNTVRLGLNWYLSPPEAPLK